METLNRHDLNKKPFRALPAFDMKEIVRFEAHASI